MSLPPPPADDPPSPLSSSDRRSRVSRIVFEDDLMAQSSPPPPPPPLLEQDPSLPRSLPLSLPPPPPPTTTTSNVHEDKAAIESVESNREIPLSRGLVLKSILVDPSSTSSTSTAPAPVSRGSTDRSRWVSPLSVTFAGSSAEVDRNEVERGRSVDGHRTGGDEQEREDERTRLFRAALAHQQIGYRGQTLFDALSSGDLPLFHFLLAHGANPHESFDDGSTFLHHAARFGYNELVIFLSRLGGNLSTQAETQFKQRPLAWAAMHGHLHTVMLFVHMLGAEIDHSDTFGFTALAHAVRSGHIFVAHALIHAGANPFCIDNDRHNLAQWAAYGGELETLSYVHARGVDLLERDTLGRTTVHWAVAVKHRGCCEYILSHVPIQCWFEPDGSGEIPAEQEFIRGLLKDPKSLFYSRQEEFTSRMGTRQEALVDLEGQYHPKKQLIMDYSRLHFGESGIRSISPLEFMSLKKCSICLLLLCALQWYLNPVSFWILFSIVTYSLSRHLIHAVHAGSRDVLLFSYMITYNLPLLISFLGYSIRWELNTLCFLVVFLGNIHFLYVSHQKNPGVVQRNENDYKRIFEAVERGQLINWSRVCPTDKIVKPLRSKHCSVRNECIERYDHYCIWILNAVGRQNHLEFFAFLHCLLFTFVFHGYACLTHILRYSPPDASWLQVIFKFESGPVNFFMVDCLAGLYVFVLTAQHWYLACKNLTTNEQMNLGRYGHFRDHTGAFRNPFDRGCLGNVKEFFFQRGGYPSYPIGDIVLNFMPLVSAGPVDMNQFQVHNHHAHAHLHHHHSQHGHHNCDHQHGHGFPAHGSSGFPPPSPSGVPNYGHQSFDASQHASHRLCAGVAHDLYPVDSFDGSEDSIQQFQPSDMSESSSVQRIHSNSELSTSEDDRPRVVLRSTASGGNVNENLSKKEFVRFV